QALLVTPYKGLKDVERAVIGAFATQHGIANASKEYKVSESTVRGIKRKYSEALLQSASGNEEDSTVTSLPKGKQGRPFVLGEDMDREVQDFIRAQRDIGAVVTRSTVIASGKAGVVMRHNKFYLKEFGGQMDLTKHWAESILHRMKFVKRRGSMKVHVLGDAFERIKRNFLADIKTTVNLSFTQYPKDSCITLHGEEEAMISASL
uniref:Uncharacterized protein n=1 Tax=Amphimedon queenslandica TaxID=400682 RepID=A0A1X7TK23_AMPQE